MNQLNDIVFFQIVKKRPKGEKKIKWVRRTHKFKEFNLKADRIKMVAEKINQKLLNY